MNIKKYITFKNGFILMCALWLISNCAGNKLNRQVHTWEVVVEGKNITIDSLQRELDLSKLRNDTTAIEIRMLKDAIEEYRGSYNILIKSNMEQARTIRKQTEIDYE